MFRAVLFSVRVGDIIESTDADPKIPGRGDSLQYYRFNIDNTGHYYLTPLYVGDWKRRPPSTMNKADRRRAIFASSIVDAHVVVSSIGALHSHVNPTLG